MFEPCVGYYVPPPLTLVKGVRKMRPGELIRINHEGIISEQWYTQRINSIKPPSDYESAQKQVRELLNKSVERIYSKKSISRTSSDFEC